MANPIGGKVDSKLMNTLHQNALGCNCTPVLPAFKGLAGATPARPPAVGLRPRRSHPKFALADVLQHGDRTILSPLEEPLFMVRKREEASCEMDGSGQRDDGQRRRRRREP